MTIGNTPGIDTESQYNGVYSNKENLHSDT